MTSGATNSLASVTRHACLIFDSDSQYFACRNLVPYFLENGWSLTFVIPGDFEPPASCSSVTIPVIRIASLNELWEMPHMDTCDAIGAYLPGSKLRQIWHGVNDFFSRKGIRPLIFAGYNGVVLQRFEDGLSWRCGFDMIPLNSPEDYEKALAFSTHSTIRRETKMPIIGINRTHKHYTGEVILPTGWAETKSVIFAEQVLFPKSESEKFCLYSQLVRIAVENPDWRIVIKPRTLPNKFTFHRQTEHISQFIARRFRLPPNMVIRYESLDELLPVSTVLLNISSTAFFDAIGLGIPSYTLSDFGISSNYGTHYFHGSGCTLCLADIGKLSHDLFIDRPKQEWLEFKGFSSSFSPRAIIRDLGELLEAERHRTAPIPFETEQRLLAPAADLPTECLVRQPFSFVRFGQRIYKFFSRRWNRVFDIRKPNDGQP